MDPDFEDQWEFMEQNREDWRRQVSDDEWMEQRDDLA